MHVPQAIGKRRGRGVFEGLGWWGDGHGGVGRDDGGGGTAGGAVGAFALISGTHNAPH